MGVLFDGCDLAWGQSGLQWCQDFADNVLHAPVGTATGGPFAPTRRVGGHYFISYVGNSIAVLAAMSRRQPISTNP